MVRKSKSRSRIRGTKKASAARRKGIRQRGGQVTPPPAGSRPAGTRPPPPPSSGAPPPAGTRPPPPPSSGAPRPAGTPPLTTSPAVPRPAGPQQNTFCLPPNPEDQKLMKGSDPLQNPFSVESRIKHAENTFNQLKGRDTPDYNALKDLFNICKDNPKQLLIVSRNNDPFIVKDLKTWSSKKGFINELMGRPEVRGAMVKDLLDATDTSNGNINVAIEKVKKDMVFRKQSNSGGSGGWFSSGGGSTGGASTSSGFFPKLGSPGTFPWY